MGKSYVILWSESAKKTLKKIDKSAQQKLINWVVKNLENCENPYTIAQFKRLKDNKGGYVRYRVGNYRIICSIYDEKLIIEIINVGHRREVYK